MSRNTLYIQNFASPAQITDELYTSVGSGDNILGTVKRAFKGSTDFVVRTASGGGGTLLVESTDYDLIDEDTVLTAAAGFTVYTGYQITNVTYQTVNLYFTYKTVGSYTDSETLNSLLTGWNELGDTLTYASSKTITTLNDLTGIIEPGMKIKLTQPTDGVKFFTVNAVTSSLITVDLIGYDLDNEAITSPYYSVAKTPLGFPADIYGWERAGETWTYASSDDPIYTFTTPGDVTSKYSVGMRIKLTDSGTQYFIIHAISYGAPNTTFTVYGGTDYDLSGGAITNPYYSSAKAPYGFPVDPNKWSITFSDTADRAAAGVVSGTVYNPNSNSFDLPIGEWDIHFIAYYFISATTVATFDIGLSTANNSFSSSTLKRRFYFPISTGAAASIDLKSRITRASKATMYINVAQTGAGTPTAQSLLGSVIPIAVTATCTYL